MIKINSKIKKQIIIYLKKETIALNNKNNNKINLYQAVIGWTQKLHLHQNLHHNHRN
jgi:hypothetical protein